MQYVDDFPKFSIHSVGSFLVSILIVWYFRKMGDREYKAILKEAREFIKAKDFKAALKEVKKVLNKAWPHTLLNYVFLHSTNRKEIK